MGAWGHVFSDAFVLLVRNLGVDENCGNMEDFDADMHLVTLRQGTQTVFHRRSSFLFLVRCLAFSPPCSSCWSLDIFFDRYKGGQMVSVL